MVQYRLPEPEEDTPASVVIRPTPPPIPQPVVPPEMQQRAEDARQQAGSVTVPARLVHPHPVVATWLADRERQRELARFEPNPTLRRLRAKAVMTKGPVSTAGMVPSFERECRAVRSGHDHKRIEIWRRRGAAGRQGRSALPVPGA